MIVYVDTSALFAVVKADDEAHTAADAVWSDLIMGDASLVTTNYVILESCALIQGRLGMKFAAIFQDDIVPLLEVFWVDCALHQAGVDALLAANRRGLSLVDCVSLTFMRQQGLRQAFTLDPHFSEQGFEVFP